MADMDDDTRVIRLREEWYQARYTQKQALMACAMSGNFETEDMKAANEREESTWNALVSYLTKRDIPTTTTSRTFDESYSGGFSSR